MKISFIIPALNEEQFIERVIKQFHELDQRIEYEVIVADGGSTDKTRDIAQDLGAKVILEDQIKNIGAGRNAGAKMATGSLFVFCDADTLLQNIEVFTNRIINLFNDENVVVAIPSLKVFPKERIWKDTIFHTFFNYFLQFSFFIGVPFSFGQCQIIRAKAFNEVEGYDEFRVHAEDSFIVKKLLKVGRIKFLKELTVFESPRRYRKIGYLNLIRLGLSSALSQLIFKKNKIKKWERVD